MPDGRGFEPRKRGHGGDPVVAVDAGVQISDPIGLVGAGRSLHCRDPSSDRPGELVAKHLVTFLLSESLTPPTGWPMNVQIRNRFPRTRQVVEVSVLARLCDLAFNDRVNSPHGSGQICSDLTRAAGAVVELDDELLAEAALGVDAHGDMPPVRIG